MLLHASPELYSSTVLRLQNQAVVASAKTVLRRYAATTILHAISSNYRSNGKLFSDNLEYLDMRDICQTKYTTRNVKHDSDIMKKLQLLMSIWLRSGSACDGYSKYFQWNAIGKGVYMLLSARERKVRLLLIICSQCLLLNLYSFWLAGIQEYYRRNLQMVNLIYPKKLRFQKGYRLKLILKFQIQWM